MMNPQPGTASAYLTEIEGRVRAALVDLDRYAAAYTERPVRSATEQAWNDALRRVESNLAEWQRLLADMAERARVAQEGLTAADGDLKRSLDQFSTIRKHLQDTDRGRRVA